MYIVNLSISNHYWFIFGYSNANKSAFQNQNKCYVQVSKWRCILHTIFLSLAETVFTVSSSLIVSI